jgi:DNA repair exonuclease SbcCD nuclease subunit
MPRIGFIYRTDTHVCDRSPASWKGDYSAEIFSNLEQIGKFAIEHKVKAVLDGGDYFHVKSASRNPHSIVVRSARLHRAYPCPTFSIIGNHDVVYNNLETIDQQPLGVLFSSGVFQPLTEQVFEDGDLRVRVVGAPYSPFRTLADLRAIKKKPGDTFLIAIVHQLAAADPPPSVEDFFGEPVFKYADLQSEDGPDVWCFGHWHKDQGVVDIGTTQFVNLGAVSRGALIRENTQRTPKVAFIEAHLDAIRVLQLPLSVAPPEDVFDFDRKERQEREETNIEQFVTALKANASFDPSASIEDNLQGLNFAVEIRDMAREYLERARGEVG